MEGHRRLVQPQGARPPGSHHDGGWLLRRGGVGSLGQARDSQHGPRQPVHVAGLDQHAAPGEHRHPNGHARRKFFELADVVSSAGKKGPGERSSIICPIVLDAVQRLDALFNIERGINGKAPA